MSITLALLLAQVATSPTPPDQTNGPQNLPAAPSEVAPTPVQSSPLADPSSAENQESLGLKQGGDIVVTARRRAESVQDVPIAMSVIGGTTLAETGVYNVGRLTQIQPSLQFYSTNPRNSAANIRGLGAPFGLTNDGIEQGVGIYVDQVYYSRIASATFDFTDTERIEVLRGPQGTLYGKNTTAGAINITTRKPSFEPEAKVELTGGNLSFFQGKASVSGPLVDDKLAVRLSASVTTRKGTIYNVTTDKYVNSQDNLGLRGQLLWKPTETLDLTLYGDYNRQNPDCCAQIYARYGSTQRAANRQFPALEQVFGYAPPSLNAFDRVTDLDTPLRAKQELGGTSLLANLDLGAATITSVTAWRFWNWDPSNDRDFTALPITTVSQNPSQQRQFSQELRLGSNGKHTFDYVVGAFYFHQTIATQGSQVQGPAASRYLLNPGSVPVGSPGCDATHPNACNPSVLDGLTSANDIHFTNDSAAVFGKLTWHVTDGLEIAPGLRVNYDKKDGNYVSVVTTGTGALLDCSVAAQKASAVVTDQCGVLSPQSYSPNFDSWNVSGDVTVSYDFAPLIHGYATYARSYKSGGINLSGLPLDQNNLPALSLATVKPEKVNNFELGLKTQLFDRRVTFNLAGFWTDIKDYQATVTNGQIGVIRGYLANAEYVRTRGVELDSAWRPTDRINTYFNAAYTDAKYVRFRQAPCPPELSGGAALPVVNGVITGKPAAPGVPGSSLPYCDISGQRLPGVSKWALSFGGEYDLPSPMGGYDGEFYVGYDGSYRSDFSSNPSKSIYTTIYGYSLHNFRVGYKAQDKFNLFGWVRNAFNNDYYEVLALQSGSTGMIVGQPGDPRTYGGTLSLSF